MPPSPAPADRPRHRARRFFGFLAGLVAVAWIAGGLALYGRGFLAGHPSEATDECPGVAAGTTLSTPPAASIVSLGAPLVRSLGDTAHSGLTAWPGPFDAAPKAFDINGDGVDELIAQSNDTNVYVFSATTGRALAVLPTSYPVGWYIERVLNGVEAATLRPGEPPSLVVTDHAACVAAWRFVPEQSDADHFAFEKSWERRMNECFGNPGMDAKPTLADLTGDGALEILVQTEEVGFFALQADGRTLWKQCWAGGNSAPVVDDLNGDGRVEAIVASDSGFLSVLDGATGRVQWTFNARDPRYGVTPASVPVAPTVAELDGQAPKEILFAARHAPGSDPERFHEYHMAIFAVHQNATTWQSEVVWMRQPAWAHPLSYTRLVVEDVDGDGSPDIFGMDWNTIGHNPGHWQHLGAAHAFRLTANGEDVWVRDVDAWWSNKDIALGDADGDGDLDLLVNGAREHSDGLWRLSPLSGTPEAFLPVAPWKMARGPLLVDLWNDGGLQVTFPVTPDAPQDARGAILVIDLRKPNESPWRELE